MGLLTDDAAPVPGGEGQKFLDLYGTLDADDQSMIQGWVESGRPATYVRAKLSAVGFHMAMDTVRAGLARLKAASWEC